MSRGRDDVGQREKRISEGKVSLAQRHGDADASTIRGARPAGHSRGYDTCGGVAGGACGSAADHNERWQHVSLRDHRADHVGKGHQCEEAEEKQTKQDQRRLLGEGRDIGETEAAGNERNDEADDGPFEHVRFP